MTKKIEHLTNELQEFFSETDSKKLSKKLGELLEVHEVLVPNKTYKQTLKSRLEHIHKTQKSPRLSFFEFLKFSGVLASFLFVSGASYLYYTMQQENLHSGIEMSLQDEVSQVLSIQDTGTQSGFLETPNKISSLETSSPVQISSVSSDEKPRTQTLLNPQKETSQKVSQGVSESISEKNIPETSQTQTPVLKIQTPEIEDSVSPSQKETQMRNTKSRDEYIITDIMNTFEAPLQDENIIPANDMIPVGDMMLKGASPMMFGVDPFFEICVSYSGSLSDDGERCFFDMEQFCTRENIFPESEVRCEYLPETPKEK